MTTKLVTTLSVRGFEDGAPPTRLLDLVPWALGQLEAIPPEYRDSARLQVGSEQDHDFAYVRYEIEYWRPQTDEEAATEARVKEHNRLEAILRAEAELARLKGEAK